MVNKHINFNIANREVFVEIEDENITLFNGYYSEIYDTNKLISIVDLKLSSIDMKKLYSTCIPELPSVTFEDLFIQALCCMLVSRKFKLIVDCNYYKYVKGMVYVDKLFNNIVCSENTNDNKIKGVLLGESDYFEKSSYVESVGVFKLATNQLHYEEIQRKQISFSIQNKE